MTIKDNKLSSNIYRQIIASSFVLGIATLGYALIVSGLSLILGKTLFHLSPYLLGLIAFIFALLLNPSRLWIEKKIASQYSPSLKKSSTRSHESTCDYSALITQQEIVKHLRQDIISQYNPQKIHIFLIDPQNDNYIAAEDENKNSTTDFIFPSDSALVQMLNRRKNSFQFGNAETLPAPVQTERARLSLLDAQVIVPFSGSNSLIGWVALSWKQSREPYSRDELIELEKLCDQATTSFERARTVVALERRIQEMDILTRIAQGINFTITFDDLLELIYTQTNNLVHVDDFFISLLDQSNESLIQVFHLEQNERIASYENQALQVNHGLEHEVIRTRQYLFTDEYEQECRRLGVLPAIQSLTGWMGVPLSAGAEVIGVISLGSRESSSSLNKSQVAIIQAIADLTAGAIVKARLFQESEVRARQLATLNEIGRSLTSTLEIQPLLNQILSSAVEIIYCEAGTLFLLDHTTGELVFEVTAGPVAENLVGQRLPAGAGLVGEAMNSGKPVIANNVQNVRGWFAQPDVQTGFITHDLLVVPMQAKGETIGVIEVINKIDGTQFNTSDQELLTTFTIQASIAIENARLYTQTDEALTARVEEMAVMQRIDRELNTSLDLSRATRITLDWSIRQSHANAGLVGVLNEDIIYITDQSGYTRELNGYQSTNDTDFILPVEIPLIKATLESGQSQSTHQAGDGYILEHALSHALIPIQREGHTIAILLLESRRSDTFNPEIINFLSRLSDHAAIAIANAQLYAEVQRANLAKTDFISLVSHELKTPMTSIKGYTDLLAQGIIGPINEAQGNFLGTIRSNVNRMATLVSDLADVSRIESGRLHLEFVAVPLAELVDETYRSTKAQIDEKGQTLTIDIADDLPLVWGDRNRLIQILTNLVSNANKYSPNSTDIKIIAKRSSNQWDSQGAPEVIHTSIQDSGYGIDEEDQKKIFQKFFRSEDQRIREAPGTGLGLNITRYLVEMQGGKIWFESAQGQGTTFHFTIPIASSN